MFLSFSKGKVTYSPPKTDRKMRTNASTCGYLSVSCVCFFLVSLSLLSADVRDDSTLSHRLRGFELDSVRGFDDLRYQYQYTPWDWNMCPHLPPKPPQCWWQSCLGYIQIKLVCQSPKQLDSSYCFPDRKREGKTGRSCASAFPSAFPLLNGGVSL